MIQKILKNKISLLLFVSSFFYLAIELLIINQTPLTDVILFWDFWVIHIASFLFTLLAAFSFTKMHKTSWLAGIIALLVSIALQFIGLVDLGFEVNSSLFVHLIFSGVLVACLFYVISISKYPHLDRRQGWFNDPAERFDLRLPVTLETNKVFNGITESVSKSGCRVKLENPNGVGQRFVSITFKDCPQVTIRAQQVGLDSSVLRLKFKEFISGNKGEFEAWLDQQLPSKPTLVES